MIGSINWLKKHRIWNVPTLIIIIAFLLFIIFLIMILNSNDEDSSTIYVTQDAEIRTGPNAAYPELYRVYKGDNYHKIGKAGKWIEVESSNHKQKGWIAGWHTNLDIQKDKVASADSLKGKTIVLDPGHGGGDQGASSRTNKKSLEKVYTLKTAKELKSLLIKEGAKVKMTRNSDTYVPLGERKGNGDAFISIHNDSLSSKKANGGTVYWYHNNQEGLAQALNQSIQKKSLLSNRGAKQENFQVLRQTKQPAVLLELGYISNPTDEDMITDQLHRHIVEQAIVDGLKNYFSN
ncbi:N-acetylmuramoyl-L-alanine amidase [Staphylococcus sp. SQ8-PEA]|uniref:Probable cell wall amidase lytH n=1 Tax=Staphylococcus marylandisciuri TaxID=2981529 RepID=A0ABT2QPY9_9STAP|nr:N-acetylmuramoyl-L-alanine amidase [Staphylococcus marylandisciuri]MCU5746043.1 N-acetylmuramoyl-L-alanine amidase [Staphylococcus marylandisciuri]